MLHVHRAERADALADALGDMLAVPMDDPFVAEVVAVPAKGVERWLAQRLSHRLGAGASRGGDGICAGVTFPSPGAMIKAATGGDDDPWRPDRSVWPLLGVVDECVGEQWFAPLAAHLSGTRRGRRYATARRLAELFASYAAHRPEMLRGWSSGRGIESDLGWQPELWRRLRGAIGAPDPVERLDAACAALRADPGSAGLPSRISLFGPTRLSTEELTVLRALAEHRDVHLWLPHPSPALWLRLWTSVIEPQRAVPRSALNNSALLRDAQAAPSQRRTDGPIQQRYRPGRPPCDDTTWTPLATAGVVQDPPRRAADPTAGAARHPLLSSLGRDVRELQVRLVGAAPELVDQHHSNLPEPPATLLGRLQRELRDDQPPGAPAPPAEGDRSVQVHSCHGPDRQVEVLREVVLGLLSADPTLEPRDIVVMCPDIEAFAPLISAGFGLETDGHPGQRLQVRLADRALRQVNPLLETVAQLLELADARLTASQVLDLLGSGPVRRRFGLDHADLERLQELAVRAGVRWGLDAGHRRPFRLDAFGQNTWAAALDRLLLGVAMPADGWLGTALPMAEVESGDTERIGRLAEFVERLAGVLSALGREQPLGAWVDTLTTALDLLTATAPADEWQAAQARSELAAAARDAGPHAVAVPLGLADVRGMLAERLRGRPTRANFRTGTLTVATLVPMRSVPHRVVCLLGLDDGVFPRAGVVDGDDLLARDPLVGERDPRSEDRQLLLDAICAATETLVVVHSGADERTGARRPPAVPLGELLDAIEAMAGPAARERVVVRHPLQPFDARNFIPGALVPAGEFSFDTAELAGARAAAGVKVAPAPFLPAPLPDVRGEEIALDDLVAFVEHPVKAFLRQRVGLSLFAGEDDPADALPVEPDGLATWAIGDRILRDRLAGHDLDRCRQAEWRRGELPPGALGDALLLRVLDDVEPLVAFAQEVATGEATDVDLEAVLPDGTRVVGTLGGLHGSTLLRVEYSRLAPKQRVRAWARLLALSAATGEPWQAVTLGRGMRHGVAVASLGPIEPEHARALLADLVELMREGLREPLPLPTLAGHAYAKTRLGGAGAAETLDEAMRGWAGSRVPENADAAHVRVWGERAGPSMITAAAGPPGGEPTRFGALAMRLWAPLLIAEDVVRR